MIEYLESEINIILSQEKSSNIINKKIKIDTTNGKILYMVFLFGDYGCSTCVDNMIDNINSIDSKYDRQIIIYYLGNNPKRYNLNNLRIHFIKKEVDNVFDGNVEIKNPIALLVSKNGIILDQQEEVVGKPDHSKKFIKKVLNILDVIPNR